MKTHLAAISIAFLAVLEHSTAAEAPMETGRGLSKPPEGLSGDDWTAIRGAYETNRHAIVVDADGRHQARNPGQAWLTTFDGRGFTVTPDGKGWTWGLELVGQGDVSEVRQEGQKISYLRSDGLTEWFINDSRGLEQGWTFEQRPERADPGGVIRLELKVRGGLRPEVADEGTRVAFLDEAGGAALTYGGLKAWDADGKTVRVRFAESEGVEEGLGVIVNDDGARYPITVDPIAQQAILKSPVSVQASGPTGFGRAVGIFADRVIVGAPDEDESPSRIDRGAAYVFVKNGVDWTLEATLRSAAANGYFGGAVAISGDTVVIGAGYGSVSNATGAAFVFSREAGVWVEKAILLAPFGGHNDGFGGSVAIEGDTIVVGATREASNATGVNGDQTNNAAQNAGAAYIFIRSAGAWSFQAYLKASNTGAGDQFGTSVAISGNTLLVGAPSEASNATAVNGSQSDNSMSSSGAAYVFVRNGTVWTQQAYLKASNTQANSDFGHSVAIMGDTAVIGSPSEDGNSFGVNGDQTNTTATDSGAGYVFVRSGNAWSQEAYLKASNTEAGDGFGASVAIAKDTIIVGAPFEDSDGTGADQGQNNNAASGAGAAYLFVRKEGQWSQASYLKAATAVAGTQFGCEVAVSGDAIVLGSVWVQQSAYVFRRAYRLAAIATYGQIMGMGDYDGGTTASLTVTASPGYLFTGWTGDASGSDNPLSVFMSTDKAIVANFSPDTGDADSDGLTNYQEIVEIGTNPNLTDTDGDGVDDEKDAFPLDPSETLDTDRDGIGDNADVDDDGDGLTDEDEITIHGTNPKRADSDGDGLSDSDEINIHLTNPNVADTEGDGLSDGAEVKTHGTNPKLGDTDGDGFLDGYEVLTGKLPLDPTSKPALVAEARTAIEFTFPAAVGRIYRIEASEDLSTWVMVESGIAGNGGVIQRFYSTRNLPRRYFRVEEAARVMAANDPAPKHVP